MTVDEKRMLQDFAALPAEAQQQVMDFIAFLRRRYRTAATKKRTTQLSDLASEPFIGMWRDREEMQDSNAWVRSLREREWEGKQ
jgi:hypothetical protein